MLRGYRSGVRYRLDYFLGGLAKIFVAGIELIPVYERIKKREQDEHQESY